MNEGATRSEPRPIHSFLTSSPTALRTASRSRPAAYLPPTDYRLHVPAQSVAATPPDINLSSKVVHYFSSRLNPCGPGLPSAASRGANKGPRNDTPPQES